MSVGIIGLGYVGLPLAVAFAQAGESVVAVDIDERRVAATNAGTSLIEDVSSDTLVAVGDRLSATTSYARLSETDAVVICVPTPLTHNREPDLTALLSAAEDLGRVLRRGQLVSLESTTYPGTTRERVVPILQERSGLGAGTDFHVCFSPERVDPGRTDYTLRTTPKLLGGLTDACLGAGRALYGRVCDGVVEVSSLEAAEMAKLLENIFRSVNIALVNELAMLADRMGIDIWEVVDAAATKPYGFMRFDPGPGMGGHCLPVDPFYLSWRARQFDFQTEFIELAGKVNQNMPYYCLERVQRVLNEDGKALSGAKIAILGASYKGGIGDTRESPAIKLMHLLRRNGSQLTLHDPHVDRLEDLDLASEPLDDVLSDADLAVIVTAHPSVDHERVVRDARRTLDLRGVTRSRPGDAVLL